eukprot:COSAG02_NODE_30931_length_542_cov_1.209932_1_plen_90_part_01
MADQGSKCLAAHAFSTGVGGGVDGDRRVARELSPQPAPPALRASAARPWQLGQRRGPGVILPRVILRVNSIDLSIHRFSPAIFHSCGEIH